MRSLEGNKATFYSWGLLALLCVLAFWPMFRNGFVWDDHKVILENPVILGLWPPLRFFKLFELPGGGHANVLITRPVVAFTFALDYALGRFNPFGYHLTNLLLHILCVFGVAGMAQKMTRSAGAGFLAGALFALHPGHAESVIAFLGRSHLFSTLFLLLGFWGYVGHLKSRGWRKGAWYGGSLVSILIGCFTNGQLSGLVFVGILVIYEGFVTGKGAGEWWQKLLRIAPFFLVTLYEWESMYAWIRHSQNALGHFGLRKMGGIPGKNYLLVFKVYTRYLKLLLFPTALSPLQEVPAPTGFFDVRVLWGAFLLLASFAVLAWTLKRDPRIGLLISWFLIALVPVLNIYPLPGVQILAERWLYLPSVGACILGGWGAWVLYQRTKAWKRRAWAGVLALILILFGVRTFLLSAPWKSEESLARAMIATAPDHPLGYTNLGAVLDNQGKSQEAIGFYHKAIELNPDNVDAYYNLGNALLHLGNAEEAIKDYRMAVALKPDFGRAFYTLGLALWQIGKTDESILAYHQAIALMPDLAEAHYNLGVALGRQGRIGEAIAAYRQAIELRPRYGQALENLAGTLDSQGKRQEAREYWRRALEVERRPEWTQQIRTRLAKPD